MAKALLGGVGRIDPRMVAEVRRLRQRVMDLESELIRLQTQHDNLAAAAADASDEELRQLANSKEPVLA